MSYGLAPVKNLIDRGGAIDIKTTSDLAKYLSEFPDGTPLLQPVSSAELIRSRKLIAVELNVGGWIFKST